MANSNKGDKKIPRQSNTIMTVTSGRDVTNVQTRKHVTMLVIRSLASNHFIGK